MRIHEVIKVPCGRRREEGEYRIGIWDEKVSLEIKLWVSMTCSSQVLSPLLTPCLFPPPTHLLRAVHRVVFDDTRHHLNDWLPGQTTREISVSLTRLITLIRWFADGERHVDRALPSPSIISTPQHEFGSFSYLVRRHAFIVHQPAAIITYISNHPVALTKCLVNSTKEWETSIYIYR